MRLDLDHIGILGPDIHALVDEFRGLGFAIVGPKELTAIDSDGRRRGLGQHSAHIMFADTYIELTAVTDPAPEHHLSRYLDTPAGVRLLILGCERIDDCRQAYVEQGLRPGPVQRATRRIDYGVPGEARFSWFGLPAGDWPEALIACVAHETRELVFQEAVTRHANGATALTALFVKGGDTLGRLQPLAADAGAEVLVDERDGAEITGIGLRVTDLASTSAALAKRGIATRTVGDSLAVDTQAGVRLHFSDA